MKRLMLLLGSTTLLNACAGKDEKPPYAPVVDTGGSTSTTGGRVHSGGASTDVGGLGTAGGASGSGGVSGLGGISNSAGGNGNLGGNSSSDVDAGGASTGGQEATAPIVSITSPVQAASPDEGPVISGTSVTVLCTAKAGAVPVDLQSRTISYVDSSGKTVSASLVNATANADEFTALFPLAGVPAGPITFRCSAADRSDPPLDTVASVQTFVDHGPSVIISNPVDKAAVSGNASLPVKFKVVPVALSSQDTGQAIDTVALKVNGVTIKANQDATDRTLYTADANLADPALFPPPLPDTMSVMVAATNKRKAPGPVTNSGSVYIYVDGAAPEIDIQSPIENQVIGGPTKVVFTVDDSITGSGVDTTSITVEFGDLKSAYTKTDPAWRLVGAGVYEYTFDTKVTNTPTQTTLYVRARDEVGNQGTKGVIVNRDEMPPFISIDPPLVRVTRPDSAGLRCSAPFDPIGSDAITSFTNTFPSSPVLVRALVMERTNSGGRVLFFAGLDPTSVKIYASDLGKPVLVSNTPGTGSCTDIETSVKLFGAQYGLNGIATNFTVPDYSKTTWSDSPPIEGASNCVVGTSSSGYQCNGTSDMFYVMPQYYNKDETAVFGVSPVNNQQSALCNGNTWDLEGAHLEEGWVCLAVQAADYVGNTAVSAPMPICFNKSGNADCSAASRPTCTDGCKAPSRSLLGDDGNGEPIPFVFNYSTF